MRPTWCTRGNEFLDGAAIPHYRERAADGFECAVWAPADRLNEHVWDDANVDWFFGDYSALGPKAGHARDHWGTGRRALMTVAAAPRTSGTSSTRTWAADPETAAPLEVLRPYPALLARQDVGELAGIRADFAQGLPNQLWEYIVNRCAQGPVGLRVPGGGA